MSMLAAPATAGAQEPDADPFYAAPATTADVKPGTILRSREVDLSASRVDARFAAWQLLYRTSDTHDAPEAAAATVIVPRAAAPAGGRPLVSYQTAEDALTTRCAPSYTLRQGTEKEASNVQMALDRGFVVVVPDYEGPESHWTAGVQEGHATLDAIRAAQRFAPAGLNAETPVGMWGYSGGGHASAWAAELQPTYAPELDIAGVAYGGVAAYIDQTLTHLDGSPFAGIVFGGAIGVGRAYPEMGLDALLNERGRAMQADVGSGCINDWVAPYAFRRLADYTTVDDPLSVPSVQAVIARASLGQRRPAGPQYVYWAIGDELNEISQGDRLVATYCAQGVPVDYRREPVGEHITLQVTGAEGALSFLADRFVGRAAPNSCPPAPRAAASPAPFAGLVAARTSLRAGRRGRLRVTVRNPNAFPVRLAGVAIRRARPRLTVARSVRRMRVPARATRTVTLRLRTHGRRQLRRTRRVRVAVKLQTRAPDGRFTTTRRAARLEAR